MLRPVPVIEQTDKIVYLLRRLHASCSIEMLCCEDDYDDWSDTDPVMQQEGQPPLMEVLDKNAIEDGEADT